MTGSLAEMTIDEAPALPLTARERDKIRVVLGSSMAGLHEGIVHTGRYECRDGPKERRAVLVGVLRRLGVTPATAQERHTEAE